MMASLRNCVRKMKSLRNLMTTEDRSQFDSDIAEIQKRKADFDGNEALAVADYLEEQEFALDDIYFEVAELAGVTLPDPVTEPVTPEPEIAPEVTPEIAPAEAAVTPEEVIPEAISEAAPEVAEEVPTPTPAEPEKIEAAEALAPSTPPVDTVVEAVPEVEPTAPAVKALKREEIAALPKEAAVTYAQEVKGQKGVASLLTNWEKVASKYDEIEALGAKGFQEIRDAVTERHGELSADKQVAEFIAIAAEKGIKKGPVGQMMNGVRKQLNKDLKSRGFSGPFSATELNTILSQSEVAPEAVVAEQPPAPPSDIPPSPPLGPLPGDFSADERRFMDKIGRPEKKEPIGERYQAIKKNAGLKLRQGLVDQYASFKGILQDDRAWMMGHLTKSHTGALEALLKYGRLIIEGGVIGVDTTTKGLQEVLKPLGANLDRFMGWIAANRASRLMGEDREHLFTEAEIRAGMAMNQGNEALFESVRKEFEALGDSVNQIAVDTGLLSATDAKMWRNEGFYLPFYRVMDEMEGFQGPRVGGNAGLVKQQAYKKLKGGKQNVNDLIENMLLNWNHLLSASLNNQAATQAIKSAEALGIATPIQKAEALDNAVYVRVDGKEQWYEIEDTEEGNLVMDSLLALNWNGLNGGLMKAGRAFKRALTVGVTIDPAFKIRNLIRDSITAIAVTGMDVNIAKNLYQGFKATGDPEIKAQMLAGGGIFGDSGYYHGADPEAIKYLVNKGVSRDTILDTRWRIKKMFDVYQDFGARGENINRAADYVQSLNEEKEDILTRTFEARDHLDFTRTGTFTAIRGIAQLVPFLNARLQGLDKLGRAAMSKDQKGRFYTVVGVYSAMSVALYLAMKDDDDYKASEQWERDTYHLFKLPGSEIMYRFPRPFEVGSIASMAERIAEQMVDDEVHGELFAERLWHTLTETFSFNPTPQALKPVLEVAMNRNWFTGRKIESQSMEQLSPEKRKRAWTSATAIAASEAMDTITWGKVVLSPVQMEHLVRGYLGWLGSTSLAATDLLITRSVTDVPVQPEKKILEYPILKSFAREGPSRNTKYTTLFYDRLGEINTAYADIRQAKQIGDMEEARDLHIENRDKLKLRSMYNKAQSQLGKINKRISQVQLNKTMTAENKRIEIDRMIMARNRITRLIAKRTQDL